MKTSTSIIIMIMMLTLSPISYGKKIIKDYSDSARGHSEYCYAESTAINMAQTDAKNNLVEECKDKGWSHVKDVTYGQTADCDRCNDTRQSKCSVTAKGWCYKYEKTAPENAGIDDY